MLRLAVSAEKYFHEMSQQLIAKRETQQQTQEIRKKSNGSNPDMEHAASLSQEVQEGEKEKKDEDKEKEKKKEAEPNFQLLENPARVMPAQLKVLTMPESCRYQPFKPVSVCASCYRYRDDACAHPGRF